MAYPDNIIRLVEGSPIGATALNEEIYNRYVEGYWLTDIKFLTSGHAFLLFVKTDYAPIGGGYQPKVNEVAASQAALDADAAAEAVNGYYPTGIFPSPSGTLFIAYTQHTGGVLA